METQGAYEHVETSRAMTLSKLLEGIPVIKMFQTLYGQMVVTHEVQVNAIQYDSRKVTRGDLFVAIRGLESDGHKYISSAISNGAKVVVLEDDQALPDSYFMHVGVVKVVVENSRAALARMSAHRFDYPSRALTMVGVTGTNGKTTTSHLVKSILERNGMTSGLIGTIEYKIGADVYPATHTTPESLELNQMLAQMVERDCSAAVMEVSSHALHQHRVDGIDFRAAIFTNLTQDHLDYHKTMDAYFEAKNILFQNLASDSWAIVNMDDQWGKRILQETKARTISYGLSPGADVYAKNISLSMKGMHFTILHDGEETVIESPLTGRFNVSNILGACSTGIALGVSKEIIRQAIQEMKSVRGRFEHINSPRGWTVIIDYAHTPDALEKALKAIHDVFDASHRGRIISVFGCGGNRDRTKRPKMAAIATALSDVTIITSDNPRHEDPDAIIREAMSGVSATAKVFSEVDREKAIHRALKIAGSGDVVLIAGKGHEDYQVIGDTKIHFSDREVVEDFLRLHA